MFTYVIQMFEVGSKTVSPERQNRKSRLFVLFMLIVCYNSNVFCWKIKSYGKRHYLCKPHGPDFKAGIFGENSACFKLRTD